MQELIFEEGVLVTFSQQGYRGKKTLRIGKIKEIKTDGTIVVQPVCGDEITLSQSAVSKAKVSGCLVESIPNKVGTFYGKFERGRGYCAGVIKPVPESPDVYLVYQKPDGDFRCARIRQATRNAERRGGTKFRRRCGGHKTHKGKRG